MSDAEVGGPDVVGSAAAGVGGEASTLDSVTRSVVAKLAVGIAEATLLMAPQLTLLRAAMRNW